MNIKQIAKVTGKSRSTISCVINGKLERVSEQTAEQIIKAWQFEKNVMKLFADDKFIDAMNIVIRHAPKNKHGDMLKRYAFKCQEASIVCKNNINNEETNGMP